MYRKIQKELNSWKIKKDRKPLIIKGARQIGKTYAVKEFGKKEYSKFHRLDFLESPALIKIFSEFNDLSPKKILEQLEIFLKDSISIDQDLLFFDEIQECP